MLGRVKVNEAAILLETSPQFVRVAMQRNILPIGIAIKMSSSWTYHISPKLLAEYCGKNVEEEVQKIRMENN
ncbi:MAG: hypothetical protein ACK5MV_13515 [Aminipila sp.]